MSAGGIDISACDDEQIHLIGAIQPHGAIVAADPLSGRLTHASANAADLLGIAPGALIGMPISDLLPRGAPAPARPGASPSAPASPAPARVRIAPADGPARHLACLAHSHAGRTVLEFLDDDAETPDPRQEAELRQRIITDLVRPSTVADLARTAAGAMRRVTGFDRVMIYRFAEDRHGEVIAEDTDRADSYLGLHYPASDIPEPARRHFVLNALRAIPDIDAAPVPILGPAETPPDLTFSHLRAVAPVHIQYLRNMGVRASMSVSLVTGERLWGLVACHHYAPRRLPLGRLRLAELIGGTVSALLQGIEDRDRLRRSIEAEKLAFEIEKEGRAGAPLAELVARRADRLMALVDAQGLVFRQSGSISTHGRTPVPAPDCTPLREDLADGVAVCDHLSAVLPMGESAWRVAAGAAYMELSGDGADQLVLLREHFEHTVDWAGRPDKLEPDSVDGAIRLGPRRSFALWREERVGRSRPFGPADREALRILRRALFALNSHEREEAAFRARREAEAAGERMRLAMLEAARRSSMGELAAALAHELNQPLAAVTNYINACRQQLRSGGGTMPDAFDELMSDAAGEASRAAELVRRLRDFVVAGALRRERTDLHATIRQSLELALLSAGDEWPRLSFEFANDMPEIVADPVQIGQVVLNLVTNAVAAMRGAQHRVLTIRTRREGAEVMVSVADTGPGIAPAMRARLFEPFHGSTTEGMGFGLSLCRSIVEAHDGRIRAAEPEEGAEIVFWLPVGAGGRRDG